MSSVNENPVHTAVKALEHAIRATHAHHHRVAEHAVASKQTAPPAASGSGQTKPAAGGAA